MCQKDRQRDGLVASFTVMHNLVLCTYYKDAYSNMIVWWTSGRLRRMPARLVQQYDVAPANYQ